MSTKNPSPDEPESERPERDPTDHSYTVHKIHQNGRDIYYTTIPIDDLFPYCFVERYCENPEEGYQLSDGHKSGLPSEIRLAGQKG